MFCPKCNKESLPLSNEVIIKNELFIPKEPINPIQSFIMGCTIATVLLSLLIGLIVSVNYMESHNMRISNINGDLTIRAKGLFVLFVAIFVSIGLFISYIISKRRKKSTEYLDYEKRLNKWKKEIELYRNLHICEDCKILFSNKESISFEGLQKYFENFGI